MKVVLAISATFAAGPICLSPAFSSVREDLATHKVVRAYADCVVKAHHARAAEAIVADVDNSTIMRRYSDLIDSQCAVQVKAAQISFAGDLYRYELADALVNVDYRKEGPTDFSNPLAHLLPPVQADLDAKLQSAKTDKARQELRKGFATDATVSALSRFGECVVRRDPVDARLWLLTPEGGPEETSRINSLRPAFAACIDGTASFGRVMMRGLVAINYYRLAKATPVLDAAKDVH